MRFQLGELRQGRSYVDEPHGLVDNSTPRNRSRLPEDQRYLGDLPIVVVAVLEMTMLPELFSMIGGEGDDDLLARTASLDAVE